MSIDQTPIEEVLVTEREHVAGRPAARAVQARCAAKCPVHWTPKITEYPEEDGYWSVTRADDVHAVSRDWETYSSATAASPR